MNNKQVLQILFFISFLALPSVIFSYILISQKGLLISIFYFVFFVSLLALPLTIIRPYYYGILVIPFLFLVPSELIHINHYDGYSTLSAFISTITTDYKESTEFFHNYRYYFYILLPIAISLTLAHFILIKPSHKLARNIKISIALTFIFAFLSFSTKTSHDSWLRNHNYSDVKDALKELYSRLFLQNYPFSYIPKLYIYIDQQLVIKKYLQIKQGFKFNATTDIAQLNTQAPIHVLVIGETSRAHNWSLNDYTRNTNPLLAKRENLSYCDSAIAVATHTRESIQLSLTRATPHYLKPISHEKSLISAFNEAGYVTIWLSNQNMLGGVDTPIYVITQESKNSYFVGGDYNVTGSFDEELIPSLNKVLTENKTKPLLIVIHTIGSHEKYRMRYPAKFERFTPASKYDDYNWNSPGIRERLLNSYDNSILYTDFILDSFISILEQQQRPVSFIYFSDHGENILDDGTSRFGHGGVVPTKYVTDIPMFFWFSDEFKTINTKMVATVTANCKSKISSNYIFDTMINFGDITINNYKPKNSLASDSFKPKERFILNTSYKPIPYSSIK